MKTLRSFLFTIFIASSFSFISPVSAATCWFSGSSNSLSPSYCSTNKRIHANGHKVWDITDKNGTRITLVFLEWSKSRINQRIELYESRWSLVERRRRRSTNFYQTRRDGYSILAFQWEIQYLYLGTDSYTKPLIGKARGLPGW